MCGALGTWQKERRHSYVAVYCSVLQRIAVRHGVLQGVAVFAALLVQDRKKVDPDVKLMTKVIL